jgi:hypothetical protein
VRRTVEATRRVKKTSMHANVCKHIYDVKCAHICASVHTGGDVQQHTVTVLARIDGAVEVALRTRADGGTMCTSDASSVCEHVVRCSSLSALPAKRVDVSAVAEAAAT